MKIWKRRAISLIAVLGLTLAGPLVLAGCEEDNDFGDRMEDAGEEVDEGVEELGDEIDDAT